MRSAPASGLEAVGDDERGAAGGDHAHGLLHARLGGEVQVGGGLVEQQDRRVDEVGPGQAHQLALAGRQRPSPLGDPIAVAARQRGDDVVGADGPCRRLDLGVGGGRTPVGDVVAHRAGEQERLLGHVPEPAAVGAEVDLGQRHAVDQHPARGRVVEAGHQLHDRRLAGPRLADEGDGLAGADVEVDTPQAPRPSRAGYWNRTSSKRIAPDTATGTGCSGCGTLRRRGHQLVDPDRRRTRLLPGVEHLGELLDGREELVEVEDEGDQRTGGECARPRRVGYRRRARPRRPPPDRNSTNGK